MILVTGGAGFIGSRLVQALNASGHEDIVVVDRLHNGRKCQNLLDARFVDYWDKEELEQRLQQGTLPTLKAVYHQGACSDTTQWDGQYLMENNYRFSKNLLEHAVTHRIPAFYASSASVYGLNTDTQETLSQERPLNMYAFSKWRLDCYVRDVLLPRAQAPLVGFRYFNVYGPQEQHKGGMSSVINHWWRAHQQGKTIQLFGAWEGYEAGQQARDFVCVDDITRLNVWALDNQLASGVYNAGTGQATTFNTMATLFQKAVGATQPIEYIPFPEALKGVYQSQTCADLTRLRQAGFQEKMTPPEEAIPAYVAWLSENTSQP